MRLFRFVLAVSVLGAASCGQPAPLSFPELEPRGGLPSGFVWQFQNGPDFYVYRATSPSLPRVQVGIYFGTAPERLPESKDAGTPGVVANQPVVWRHSFADGVHRADTALPYRHSPSSVSITVHAWVTAPTADDLTRLQASLATVQFRPRATGSA
jgi:hypothetical protein